MRGAGPQLRHHAYSRGDNRSQHRISQDLEMMNLAISGMDSLTAGSEASGRGQPVYVQSTRGGVDVKSSSRQHRSDHTHSASGPAHSRHHSNAIPTSTGAITSSGVGVPMTNTFRPITPTVASGYRASSAPHGEDAPPAVVPPTTSRTPSSMLTQQHRRDLRQFSHSAGHTQNIRNPLHANSAQLRAGSRDGRQFSQSTGPQGHSYRPPQVTADSYDYLPPYSPPEPPAARQPGPPGQARPREEGGVARTTYEPPPSYDEIFGGSSSPSSGRQRGGEGEGSREQSRRRHRSRDSSSLGRNQSSGQSERPSSRQGSSRLSSITNLFRRSRKTSRQEQQDANNAVATTTTDGVGDDYTAQWVESYSHTPRPHNLVSQQQQQQNIPVHTSAARNPATPTTTSHSQPGHTRSQSSHTHHASGTQPSPALSRNLSALSPPIPYRAPPPLVSPDNPQQATSRPPLTRGRTVNVPIREPRGSLNLSMTRLPTDPTPCQQGQGQRSSRERPRPVSAYFQLDSNISVDHGILHSNSAHFTPQTPPFRRAAAPSPQTPPARHIHSPQTPPLRPTSSAQPTPPRPHSQFITNTRNMSSSCSNIATNQAKKQKNPARSSLRRRGSGRGFLAIQQQRGAGQEGLSSQRSSGADLQRVQIGGNSSHDVSERSASQASMENLGHTPSTAATSPRRRAGLQDSASSLVANGNANNTNSNEVSSPRASAASSPINHVHTDHAH